MKKRRTREHIIADLSVNYVERFILLCRHTLQRLNYDYGYDLFIQTFDAQGQLEPGYSLLQLKATDAPKWSANKAEMSLTLTRSDLESWRDERNAVFVMHYDESDDKAYWIQLTQDALTQRLAESGNASFTFRIPTVNVVNQTAIETIREIKNGVNQRAERRSLEDV